MAVIGFPFEFWACNPEKWLNLCHDIVFWRKKKICNQITLINLKKRAAQHERSFHGFSFMWKKRELFFKKKKKVFLGKEVVKNYAESATYTLLQNLLFRITDRNYSKENSALKSQFKNDERIILHKNDTMFPETILTNFDFTAHLFIPFCGFRSHCTLHLLQEKKMNELILTFVFVSRRTFLNNFLLSLYTLAVIFCDNRSFYW